VGRSEPVETFHSGAEPCDVVVRSDPGFVCQVETVSREDGVIRVWSERNQTLECLVGILIFLLNIVAILRDNAWKAQLISQ